MKNEQLKKFEDGGVEVIRRTDSVLIKFNSNIEAIVEDTLLSFQIDLDALRREADSSDFDEDLEYYLLTPFIAALDVVFETTKGKIVFSKVLNEVEIETALNILYGYVREEGQA